jgi:hypothetical protein
MLLRTSVNYIHVASGSLCGYYEHLIPYPSLPALPHLTSTPLWLVTAVLL